MNDFIVLLEGNKEVYSEQVDKQGAAKFKGGGSIRPWEDNEETRSIDVSAKLF